MLKKLCTASIFLFVFSFSVTLLGDESAQTYFPGTLGSYWVYEDQDGNELTRTAVEGEEIAGEIYHAFSYEPELEDWANYSPFIFPSLYQVSDEGITIVASDAVEEAFKARFTKEVADLTTILGEEMPELTFDIQGEAPLFLLPNDIVVDEEWDANQFAANIRFEPVGSMDFTIIETGIVLDTETVETVAGTFEDCLRVVYRTETTAVLTPQPPPGEVDAPGETVTTLWFAPNVGIVKYHQQMDYIFLEMIPDEEDLPIPPGPTLRTLELKRYEIKTATPENDGSK